MIERGSLVNLCKTALENVSINVIEDLTEDFGTARAKVGLPIAYVYAGHERITFTGGQENHFVEVIVIMAEKKEKGIEVGLIKFMQEVDKQAFSTASGNPLYIEQYDIDTFEGGIEGTTGLVIAQVSITFKWWRVNTNR